VQSRVKLGFVQFSNSYAESGCIQLAPISHTFSRQIATLLPEIHRQDSEDSVHATRPRCPDDEDQVTECASCPRKCEKSGLDLANKAIATSGCYIQNWTIDAVSYTHIIDPITKQPIQNSPISSVSVLASTCAEADALATALMLFPSKEAAETWASERKLHVFIW
jgi:hypothetical protein